MWVQITFGVIFVKLHIFWNGKKGQLLMILLPHYLIQVRFSLSLIY